MPTRPVRVVHVIPRIAVGGAELQLCELVSGSDPARCKHLVLYYGELVDDICMERFRASGIEPQRIPRDKRHPLRFLRDLRNTIRAANPDVVQCWLAGAMIWGRFAGLWAGVPHIVLNNRSSVMWMPLMMRVLNALTQRRMTYVANSRASARRLATQIGVPAERFQVIYNGVDIRRAEVTGDRESLRALLRCTPDDRIVMMVGRLTHAKNYPMLLRLAARCRGRLPVKFAIVGHGELEETLHSMARELDVTDNVHFLGMRDNVDQLLAAADLFCYTSWYEGFPNAVLEAMVAGLPIVATNFAGVDEFLKHERSALIVPVDDDEAAFAAIERLCSNQNEADRLGQAAQREAIERFSVQAMVENMTRFCERLTGLNASGPMPLNETS